MLVSFGAELELGDADRTVKIPEKLGSWEFSETDIYNVREPYKYVAADPLGESPPMGGEINVRPSNTITGLISNIEQIFELFPDSTVPASAHFHVHVHVAGLKEDIELLKKLTKYIKENQKDFVDHVYNYKEDPLYKYTKTAKMYLKYDGGRLMPDYMLDNILTKANNFDEYIKMHAAGKDGVSMGRPFRYAINTYCLKHIDTVEFRCFRMSKNLIELTSCIFASYAFLLCALKTNVPVKEWLHGENYFFPKYTFDLDAWLGFEATRHPKERGKKVRVFYDTHS